MFSVTADFAWWYLNDYHNVTECLSWSVPEYLVCVFQVVFVRKLLVLVVSIWFPPVTSMTTRALSLAFIVLFSLVLHCILFYASSTDYCIFYQ